MGQLLQKITSPTLLINEDICRKNIQRMAKKAKQNGVIFRPHFKTPVSLKIGEWFREYGVDKITVSSLEMAEYFANGGWNNITVAFPVNIRKIELINRLAEKIQLNLVVENRTAFEFLNRHLKHDIDIYIKIDVGTNRTGLAFEDLALILNIITFIDTSKKMNFKGILSHAGHTYHARGVKDIAEIHEEYQAILLEIKRAIQNHLTRSRYDSIIIISIGDTPSCSKMEDFTWADEMRPGNFIFYDVMQWIIGSNSLDEIAVAMACPIVAKHEKRKEIIIHGGAVHFARDSMQHPFLKQTIYGLVVELNDNSWSHPTHKSYLAKLSQEHGTLKMSDELFQKYNVGDLIGILPIHSCMTADCMGKYMDLKGKVIERM
ncbi:MAG: D-serine deaminase-like pyridoxal phosphate-dependent protein [Maribacter sp.]|jgi:D-serine deaminase-like pyridoxal phosphate-dependent protein